MQSDCCLAGLLECHVPITRPHLEGTPVEGVMKAWWGTENGEHPEVFLLPDAQSNSLSFPPPHLFSSTGLLWCSLCG